MTMMPGHPKWEQFLDLLEGAEALNFTQSDPDDATTIKWTCHNDFRFTRTILEAWELKVDASITYFRECGNHCDCEIIFNQGGD